MFRTKTNAVVTAAQIAIKLTAEGYDQKTLSEFLNRFEEVMTGVKLGKVVK